MMYIFRTYVIYIEIQIYASRYVSPLIFRVLPDGVLKDTLY